MAKQIIDVHSHPDWHGYGFDAFIENMKVNNIAKAWLLSWETRENEYPAYARCGFTPVDSNNGPIPFSRCLHFKEKAPDKFILGYANDPRHENAKEILQAAVKTYGVQVYGELKVRIMYDNYDVLEIFRYCGEQGIPVLLHLQNKIASENDVNVRSYWYGGDIDTLERVLNACPHTTFIGHATGFWSAISNDDQYSRAHYPKGKVYPGGKLIELLKRHKNLFCDISGGSGLGALQRDPDFGKDFLVEFQDRILFGRDEFDNGHYMFLEGLDLDEPMRNKIYYENADNLIRK